MNQQNQNNKTKRFYNIVSVYFQAVKFHRIPTYNPTSNGHSPSKRSNIKTFSRHSRLRLRESIAKYYIDNSSTYGLTLTLPWQSEKLNLSFDEITQKYKECFNRFTIYFKRSFPNSGCIFRHELQTRKIPHCHLIVYVSNFDQSANIDLFKSRIISIWLNALNHEYYTDDINGFLTYGVHTEKLKNQLALFRYLSDHTSKSKQAQSGYIGKHWGIINKKLFVSDGQEYLYFSDTKSRIFFSRHISNVCRFSISYNRWLKSKPYTKIVKDCHFKSFGSKKISKNSISGFRFVSSKSLSPLLRYMRKYDMILDDDLR